ncbi:related to TWF1 - twinfilin, an actin monomer sequestering protein [Fusarium torulosum]|uniref:Related to TWF1 - twinfilin, an actin monomer sequestering protein n=1 Tax=Fusarium torulosum TaxID=33205 RepID=A0AAE8SEQ5_9HYPO|nr:related to TWF1 - twinfilin, an actin monomer sequestering protein [Fusarium torulosum]
MISFLLIAIFGIANVLGQASYGTEQFKYWGCATVDAAGFSAPVQLPNGVLSPESCQAVCAGHMFAAVSPDGCRCGDDPNAIKSIDEHSCNYPCSQDPNSPMCGGICPQGTPGISNLFIIQPALLQTQEIVPEPSNPADRPVSSSNVPSLATPGVSFASDALPWATTLSPPSSPTISFSSTLTLPQSEPPVTPAGDIQWSTLEDPGFPLESQTVPTTRETLVTETGPEPDPSVTPSLVGVSGSGHLEIPMLVSLSELLLIAAVFI